MGHILETGFQRTSPAPQRKVQRRVICKTKFSAAEPSRTETPTARVRCPRRVNRQTQTAHPWTDQTPRKRATCKTEHTGCSEAKAFEHFQIRNEAASGEGKKVADQAWIPAIERTHSPPPIRDRGQPFRAGSREPCIEVLTGKLHTTCLTYGFLRTSHGTHFGNRVRADIARTATESPEACHMQDEVFRRSAEQDRNSNGTGKMLTQV